MRTGIFDYSVMAAPFRQWPQFLVAFAFTFALDTLLYEAVNVVASRFADNIAILFCETLFASLVFDAYWLSALTGVGPRQMIRLPCLGLFWKFLALACALDFSAIIMLWVAFSLNGDKLSIEDFGPVRWWLDSRMGPIGPESNFIVTILTTVAVIGRLKLTLSPAFLMMTGRFAHPIAAWKLSNGVMSDLGLVNLAVSLPIFIIGMFAVLMAPTGLPALAIMLTFTCLQRAFINPVYIECLAGKIEHGELVALTHSDGKR